MRYFLGMGLCLFLLGCTAGGDGLGLDGEKTGFHPSGTSPQGGDDVIYTPGQSDVFFGSSQLLYTSSQYIAPNVCQPVGFALVNSQNQPQPVSQSTSLELSVIGNANLYSDANCLQNNPTLTFSNNTHTTNIFIRSNQTTSIQLEYQGQFLTQIQFANFSTHFSNDFNNTVYGIANAKDGSGSVFVVGAFTVLNNTVHNRLVKLRSDGSLDPNFNIHAGFSFTLRDVVTTSNTIHVGGNQFNFVDEGSEEKNNLQYARLDYNGNFASGLMVFGQPVYKILLNEVGTFILGNFSSYKWQNEIYNSLRIARVGSTSNFPVGFDNVVFGGTVDESGKLLCVGAFSSFGGVSRNGIARLNPNGTLDTSFNVGSGFPAGSIRTVKVAPDGKIYVGGNFSSFNGTSKSGVVRLHSNGSLDTSFSIGNGFTSGATIHSLALAPDGKIYVGGDFNSFNGATSKSLIRLNSNGSRDTSFQTGIGFNGTVFAIEPTNDGSNDLWVGGNFTLYKGYNHRRFIRLNSMGNPS